MSAEEWKLYIYIAIGCIFCKEYAIIFIDVIVTKINMYYLQNARSLLKKEMNNKEIFYQPFLLF